MTLLAAQEGAAQRPLNAAIASYAAVSAGTTAPATAPATPVLNTLNLPTAPTGTQISLRFAGVLPDLPAAAASATTGQLVATVVGQTPAGQTIIDTAVGRLALTLPAAADIVAGTHLAFDIMALAGRTGSPAAAAGIPGGSRFAALAPEWPALSTALAALSEADAPLARQVLDLMIPRPDSARFLAQILGWIAEPAKDAAALLGNTAADTLQHAGRTDLLTRLDADLREAVRLNASASDWQVFYVPILDTTEMRQLRVFTRRRRADRGKQRPGDSRFIVEVEFSDLGPLQLDGLVHKPRLDLILRSHAALPAPLRTGISDVFAQTCQSAGLQGTLVFQAAPAFPVSPLEDITKNAGSGLSV
jgi:hypothetical protein